MKKQFRMIMMVAVSLLGVGTLMTTGCKSNSGPEEKRTAGTYVDDSAITAKIKSKMIGDNTVKAHEINVDTFQGNVQLNGFVDSEAQRSRAEQIARDTKGVVSVQNNLQLRTEAAGAAPSNTQQGSSSGAQIQGQSSGGQVKGSVQTNP